MMENSTYKKTIKRYNVDNYEYIETIHTDKDYHLISKQIFDVFNDIRQNPDKYIEIAKANDLLHWFVCEGQTRPNYVLWTEKIYNHLNEYVLTAGEAFAMDQLYFKYQGLLPKTEYKTTTKIARILGEYTAETAIIQLLKQLNMSNILTVDFHVGTVLVYQTSQASDCYMLILTYKE